MTDKLAEALRTGPATPPPPAPVETLVRRGKRAKRIRTVTLAGLGAGCLALAVTAGLAVAGDQSQPQPPPQRLTPLTNAAAHTTFRLNVTFTLIQKGRRDQPDSYEGAFDATARKGYLRAAGVEYRFIGDTVYLQRGGWRKDANGLTFLTRGTVDPVDLAVNAAHPLRPFQNLGKVGRAADGTYRFTIAPARSMGSPAGLTVSGSLVLAPDGRLQKVVQSTVIKSQNLKIADRMPVHFTSTTVLSDYGVPVNVERPAV
jgi:hypothetical protein